MGAPLWVKPTVPAGSTFVQLLLLYVAAVTQWMKAHMEWQKEMEMQGERALMRITMLGHVVSIAGDWARKVMRIGVTFSVCHRLACAVGFVTGYGFLPTVGATFWWPNIIEIIGFIGWSLVQFRDRFAEVLGMWGAAEVKAFKDKARFEALNQVRRIIGDWCVDLAQYKLGGVASKGMATFLEFVSVASSFLVLLGFADTWVVHASTAVSKAYSFIEVGKFDVMSSWLTSKLDHVRNHFKPKDRWSDLRKLWDRTERATADGVGDLRAGLGYKAPWTVADYMTTGAVGAIWLGGAYAAWSSIGTLRDAFWPVNKDQEFVRPTPESLPNNELAVSPDAKVAAPQRTTESTREKKRQTIASLATIGGLRLVSANGAEYKYGGKKGKAWYKVYENEDGYFAATDRGVFRFTRDMNALQDYLQEMYGDDWADWQDDAEDGLKSKSERREQKSEHWKTHRFKEQMAMFATGESFKLETCEAIVAHFYDVKPNFEWCDDGVTISVTYVEDKINPEAVWRLRLTGMHDDDFETRVTTEQLFKGWILGPDNWYFRDMPLKLRERVLKQRVCYNARGVLDISKLGQTVVRTDTGEVNGVFASNALIFPRHLFEGGLVGKKETLKAIEVLTPGRKSFRVEPHEICAAPGDVCVVPNIKRFDSEINNTAKTLFTHEHIEIGPDTLLMLITLRANGTDYTPTVDYGFLKGTSHRDRDLYGRAVRLEFLDAAVDVKPGDCGSVVLARDANTGDIRIIGTPTYWYDSDQPNHFMHTDVYFRAALDAIANGTLTRLQPKVEAKSGGDTPSKAKDKAAPIASKEALEAARAIATKAKAGATKTAGLGTVQEN